MLNHKRKLLVRDWFFYAVWCIRLKQILKDFFTEDDGSLVNLNDRYRQMFYDCFDPQLTFA